MKKFTCILMATLLMVCSSLVSVVEATEKRAPLFTVPIIGYTDLDGIDFAEGMGSGLLGKDIREPWDSCLNGIPEILNETYALCKKFVDDLSHPADIFSKPTKFIANFRSIIKIVKEGPKEVKNCALIV